ncbi:MAG: hypothetical protein ACRCSU_07340 [Paracoccaceae bacterium]
MVELVTAQLTPSALAAGQVRGQKSSALYQASGAMKSAADSFTAFYEKEASINRERILAQAQADWTIKYTERADQAGPGFADSMLSEYNAYVAKAMETAPERGKDELQLAFDKYGIDLRTRAIQAEIAARKRAAAAAAAEARRARGAALANEKRMKGNALVSDPTQLQEFMEADPENADYYAKIALDARMMDDPAAVRDEMIEGQWDAYLSPSEKLAFVEGGNRAVERRAREDEVARATEQGQVEAALQEEMAYAMANGAPPVDSIYSDALIDSIYDEEQAPAVKAEYAESMAYAQTLYSVNTASGAELTAMLTEAAAKITAPGRTDQDVKEYNQLALAARARQEAIVADPATFVTQGSDETAALLTSYQEAPQEVKDISARSYVSALDYNYSRLGVDPAQRAVLPKPMAAEIVGQFNSMAPDVASQAYLQYLKDWGSASPRVARDLASAGLAPEFIAAARVADDPGLAASVLSLRGQDMEGLTKGLPTVSVTDARTALSEGLAEYRAVFETGDATGQAMQTFNSTYAIAEKLTIQGIRNGLDPETAVERATAGLFPEGVIDTGAMRVIVPKGISTDAVELQLEDAMGEAAIRAFDPAPIDDPRFPEFADKEVFVAAAQQGLWLNNSDGTGAVLHINVSGYPIPVMRADGTMYEVKFQNTAPANNFIDGLMGRSFR